MDINEELIGTAIRVYTERIHCQPLPLFEPSNLAINIRKWPEYIFLSFIALIARFSPAILPNGHDRLKCQAKARRLLMIQVSEDNVGLEVLQSLCLLILEEIGSKIPGKTLNMTG
jgi:hypothetical protein